MLESNSGAMKASCTIEPDSLETKYPFSNVPVSSYAACTVSVLII